MAITALITYVHFLSIIALFVALTIEKLLFKKELDLKSARTIMAIDGIYGAAAILLLLTGILKYFLFGKGIAYYSHNYLMWIKLGMFTMVGLLSIYPTVYFLKWRKKIREGAAIVITDKEFKTINMCIHLELGIAIFIPLLATFLARGFGIF